MKRKPFALTWWGKTWIGALERLGVIWENRLPRGRTYARKGMVLNCDIQPGLITARVAGTRETPYKIKIKVKEFTKETKEKIFQILRQRPLLVSSILNLTLPENIVEIFKDHGIDLLPTTEEEFDTDCTCPDWANPCKHIAAVFYVLAEVIDNDPFVLFTLRGIPKEEFLKQLKLIEEKDNISSFMPSKSEIENFYSYKENTPFPSLSLEGNGKNFIFSVLTDNPIFYRKGDFKEILGSIYDSIDLNTFLENGDDYSNLINAKGVIFLKEKNELFIYGIDKHISLKQKLITISDNGELKQKRVKGISIELDKILPYLASTSLTLENEISPAFFTYIYLAHFALALVENSYYIPSVEQTSDKNVSYRITYKSYLISKKLKEIFDKTIKKAPPCTYLRYINKRGYLPPQDVMESFLDTCINILVKKGIGSNVLLEDEYLFVFKEDKSILASTPQINSFFSALKSWLAPLILRKKQDIIRIGLVLKPAKRTKNWVLEPRVFPDDNQPVNLKKFWKTAHDKDKKEIIDLISILTRHIPVLSSLEAKKGGFKEKITVKADDLLNLISTGKEYLQIFDIPLIFPEEIKEVLKIRPRIQTKSLSHIEPMLSLKDMLKFEWQVSLGDITLSREEFLKLCEAKTPLVKIKEDWLLIKPDELERVKRILNTDIEIKDYAELMRSALMQEIKTDGGAIEFIPPEEIKTKLEGLSKLRRLKTPAGLKANLRPYQLTGYRWMVVNCEAGFGACLADDMGLGKTIQAIALILYLKKKKIRPALIVAPTTLLGNWQQEIDKFAPSLNVYSYHGTDKSLDNLDNIDVVLTTYGVLRQKENQISPDKFPVVIIDEAQNIKNPFAAQTKAVYSLNKAPYRIALSGTPIENRLMELWSIFQFLNPGLLGSQQYFKKHFSIPIERYGDEEAKKDLRRIISPFILRRQKTDKTVIRDLPEKIEKNEYCPMSQDQITLYEEVVKTSLGKIFGEQGITRKGLVLKLMLSLKQICNHPALYLKQNQLNPDLSGKSMRLIELLDEIKKQKEKVLIFSQFREMGHLLKEMILKELGEEVMFLHGGVARKKRDEMIKKFSTEKSPWIFILSLKAGGTGLNLVSANHVIHYDLWWNPAVEDQASDRAYRIGQKSNVFVHRLLTKGTIEEKIDRMLEKKRALSKSIVDTGETWITELKDDELRELVELEKG